MTVSVVASLATTPLAIHRWPASGGGAEALPLVLLHGWGGDSRVWSDVIPLLQPEHSIVTVDLPGFGDSPGAIWLLDSLLAQLASALPSRCLLLGWSLGGMLATAYAGRYPERVAGLITLACNASFIQRDGWSSAMTAKLFRQFCASFTRDCAATLQQFSTLQARGDDRERAVARHLRSHLPDTVPSQWHEALHLLGELDNRDILAALTVPALHIFGEQDNLVPAAAAHTISQLSPCARVRVLPGVAHAPQLSSPAELAILIRDFVRGLGRGDGHAIDKSLIARSFSRAADTYDQVAHLQKAVGLDLLQCLPEQLPVDRVADLGCGTGVFTGQLAKRYPHASTLGIDLAEGMVAHARRQYPGPCQWLCGDAEAMPCADNSLGLVFSNFALQWCQDLSRLMAELHRVLGEGGSLLFSTVGPASLGELRQAWQKVDSYVHVNRFTPVESVRSAVEGAGFDIREFSVAQRVNHYPQLRDLTRELKGLGAHNVNRGRNAGLTGRRHIEALRLAYEHWRTPEGLPASWEILTVLAVKRTS